jgi:hypothetical protein
MKNKISELIIAQKTQQIKLPSPPASFQVLVQEDSLFLGELQELAANSRLPRSPQTAEEESLVGKTVFAILAGGGR